LEEAVAVPPPKKSKAEKRVVPPPKVEESSEESDEEEVVHVAEIFLPVLYWGFLCFFYLHRLNFISYLVCDNVSTYVHNWLWYCAATKASDQACGQGTSEASQGSEGFPRKETSST
jgi:hypothetical protein